MKKIIELKPKQQKRNLTVTVETKRLSNGIAFKYSKNVWRLLLFDDILDSWKPLHYLKVGEKIIIINSQFTK